MVIDIHEDAHIRILLGRPFLDTYGTIIDVKRGKLTIVVGDEKIKLLLSNSLKIHPLEILFPGGHHG